ncbi:MAG: tRNA (guanine(10)-N(2))-dimethyltransferase [Candidatus Bathyarchaeota archaeon]|nr:tRNA (guanine(10)-N(2))-dimethyltransferase [Candidatus Bathyarchaeota archaeon]
MEFSTVRIQEGIASILVPELADSGEVHIDHARSVAPVFYNPVMKLNRDSAVLVLKAHRKKLSRAITVCEPMCGTGVRGIRLALEVEGVERAVLGDLNPLAVELAGENIALNRVSDRVHIRQLEANLLLSLHASPLRRFDYIDIDPYGSPSPFLDAAVRACRRDGLIALTATDMAPLCGVNPRACLRKYGGRPLRTSYCREQALRLVIGALTTAAARHEEAPVPIFSYAADHYVRTYAKMRRGAKESDRGLSDMGYVLHCFECSNRRVMSSFVHGSLECDVCGAEMGAAGPLWIGDLADGSFCDDMLEASERSPLSSNRELMSIVRLVKGEIGFPPSFYDIDEICSRLGIPSVATSRVFMVLREAGLRVTRTHMDRRGFKTDASTTDLEYVLKEAFKSGGGQGPVP